MTEEENLRQQLEEIKKAARALVDKLRCHWEGKDYKEYSVVEDQVSHPISDLEQLLVDKPMVICDCGVPGCNKVYDHRR